MTYCTSSGYRFVSLMSLIFITNLSSCGSKGGSKEGPSDQSPSVELIPLQPTDKDKTIKKSTKSLILPANRDRVYFKFATFNIENFGDNGNMEFAVTRRERLQKFMEDNFQDVDVLAVQEIKDEADFKELVAPHFYCYGSSPDRQFRIQNVLVCVRKGLGFKVAPSDDNFLIEEIAEDGLRPAVHGIITDEAGKTDYFYVITAHLKANPGEEFSNIRAKQSKILAQYLEKAPKALPQIVGGDFNTHANDLENINQIFSQEVGDLEYVDNNLSMTYLFGDKGSKLDHFWASNIIKTSASVKVTSTAPCSHQLPSEDDYFQFKRYISDHCPVFLGLQLRLSR